MMRGVGKLRKISQFFMDDLQDGFLASLLDTVKADLDLDLEIREDYLNIYYKGNSILKLDESRDHTYHSTIHKKFLGDFHLPEIQDRNTVSDFIKSLPAIKQNILLHGASSIEIEYEQMIIRANNNEPRNNSEYFILDRQYSAGKAGRFDLTGFYWPRNGRHKGQSVPLCLIEIKYALNQDIQKLDEQICRYYDAVQNDVEGFCKEAETIFQQKLALGLLRQPPARVEAMKTLKFIRDIDQFQFLIMLVDYNPFSKHLDLRKLSVLPFARQIRIFYAGFGLWEQNMLGVTK